MKIQLLSDTHFEFHPDWGKQFIDALDPSDVDVLVLAGDIFNLPQQEAAVKWFCEKYSEIILVGSNHHYWNSDKEIVHNQLRALEALHSNFHFLDNQILELNGQRFLGGTMWFRPVPEHLEWNWVDFHKIKDLKNWVYQSNAVFIKLLEDNLQKEDVVITHHLPSWKCVDPQYQNSNTNCFFVCDVENLIVERNPALMLHGHTHCSVNTKLDYCDTQIICNPYGYFGYELNPNFDPKLVIEI